MIARLLAAFVLALALHAQAQAYPNKAVRIVAPFPAGGSADLIPRIIGEKLSLKWGQPVIVENRAGAAGNIGAEYVFKAEPDGYVLLSSPPPPLIISPNLYRNLPFDPAQFVPVGIMVAIPNVVLVNPKVPVNSIGELIAFARANPDKLNYASQGSGTTSHLTGEMFKSLAGVRITHVPYKGSAPALTDLLGGGESRLMALPRIAIATGDPAGIGPEVALKAALAPQVRKICRPLLVGDRGALEAHAGACGLEPDLRCVTRAADEKWGDGALTLVERKQFKPGELHIGAIAAPHGEAALDSAKTAIDAALAGEVDAVVAAPHTESSIKLAGIEFDGYPTFVARCAGVSPEDAFLMICFDSGGTEMRIAHATLHASLRRAIKLLTRDRVLNAIRSADSALRRMGKIGRASCRERE